MCCLGCLSEKFLLQNVKEQVKEIKTKKKKQNKLKVIPVCNFIFFIMFHRRIQLFVFGFLRIMLQLFVFGLCIILQTKLSWIGEPLKHEDKKCYYSCVKVNDEEVSACTIYVAGWPWELA